MQRQTTIIENSMIWCGAGISIAEILTGTYLAPPWFYKRDRRNYPWPHYRLFSALFSWNYWRSATS